MKMFHKIILPLFVGVLVLVVAHQSKTINYLDKKIKELDNATRITATIATE